MIALGRVVSHVVRPRGDEGGADPLEISEDSQVARALIVLLCNPIDAAALGTALGAAMAQRGTPRRAIVATWAASEPLDGAETAATGDRLKKIALPAGGDEAAVRLRELLDRTEWPVLVVLAGLRSQSLDWVLGEADRVIVAAGTSAPAGLAQAVSAGIGAVDGEAVTLEVALGPIARRALAFGLPPTPRVRSRLASVFG